MDRFLADVGLFAIAIGILLGVRKVLEYNASRKNGFYEDEKVYKAARQFVHGASSCDVKEILAGCLDFDREDVENILSRSISHRSDKDGGYDAFIKSVNMVLGVDVYDELHQMR